MNITVVKTELVRSGDPLELFLRHSIHALTERSVVVISSKVVSLTEGRTVLADAKSRTELVHDEAEWLLPNDQLPNTFVTVTNGTLMLNAGIDQLQNGRVNVLLPTNPQQTANNLRHLLCEAFGVREVGVIISDTTSRPLRRGTTGIALAHSGFVALKQYEYSRPSKIDDQLHRRFTNASHADGLAAAAVVVMGEGNEQTPIAIIDDVSFVQFQDRDPTSEELAELYTDFDHDMYAPMLKSAPWQRGKRS